MEDAEGIYNVASRDTRLLKDFVIEVRDIINKNVNIKFGAKKTNEKTTFWLEPNCEKINDLGYKDKILFSKGIDKKVIYE